MTEVMIRNSPFEPVYSNNAWVFEKKDFDAKGNREKCETNPRNIFPNREKRKKLLILKNY